MTQTNILVMAPAWVGDMVIAQSLLMTLKDRYGDAAIDVAAPAATFPLLAHMPQIRDAIPTTLRHRELALPARRRLGLSLRHRRYDQAIVLPNSFKSALPILFARVPRRTGWRGEMRLGVLNDVRRLDRQALPRMIDRFNALAFDKHSVRRAEDFPAAHRLPSLRVDEMRRDAALERHGLARDRPILALAPGAAFGPTKRWPEARYAEVARRRIADGWQVWIFGASSDAAAASAVQAMCGAPATRCRNLAGRTTLSEAVELLSCADVVVSNDSGLLHVAAAVGRPVIGLYGSTSPRFTPPLSAESLALKSSLPCSPCFARSCRFGHLDCLREIEIDAVLDAVASAGRPG